MLRTKQIKKGLNISLRHDRCGWEDIDINNTMKPIPNSIYFNVNLRIFHHGHSAHTSESEDFTYTSGKIPPDLLKIDFLWTERHAGRTRRQLRRGGRRDMMKEGRGPVVVQASCLILGWFSRTTHERKMRKNWKAQENFVKPPCLNSLFPLPLLLLLSLLLPPFLPCCCHVGVVRHGVVWRETCWFRRCGEIRRAQRRQK